MTTHQDLKIKKKKVLFTPKMMGVILFLELFSNVAFYFALKSNNQPMAVTLMALIVLGYLGLAWQK